MSEDVKYTGVAKDNAQQKYGTFCGTAKKWLDHYTHMR